MPTNLANNTEYALRADSQELHRGRVIGGKAHSSTLKFSCAVMYTKSHNGNTVQ